MAVPDIVVVGAGVVGLFCAVRLAEAGARVALVERGLAGAESSTATGGGVRQQFGAAANIQMSRLAAPTWDGFAEDFGVDPLWRETGYLFLARTSAEAKNLQTSVALQHALGVDSHYLPAEEIASRWPFLAHRPYLAASYRQKDGWLNHHRVIDGLVRKALSLNVQLELGSEVVSLVRAGSRVRGVQTTTEVIEADAVVLATGSWASQLLGAVGIDLPFASRRHELLVVSAPDLPRASPWLIGLEDQVHLRPDAPGRALVGGFLGHDDLADPDLYSKRADDRWRRDVLAAAAAAFGVTKADAEVFAGWAGLYPGTPDAHPVIDHLGAGLYCALGFSGTGLMHAPAAGRLIAELVIDGALRSIAPGPLSAARFKTMASAVERTGF